MLVPTIDNFIGMNVYGSNSFGIGGVIKQFSEDFIVEEVLIDGSEAEVTSYEPSSKPRVLESSSSKGKFALNILIKRNWDTFRAINLIADQLGIKKQKISIGGIKDAKAVTAQFVTIEGLSAEQIKRVQLKDIKILPIGYLHTKISSYFLLGNHFNIVIRSINHSPSTIRTRIRKTISELEAKGGLPNFFGYQRFGTIRPITHLVGKALITGDLKGAILLFLTKSSSDEHPESRQAREQLLNTQDFNRAVKFFPKYLYFELLLLKHLSRKPGDFVGAFKRLPLKLRQLFPQAYQAYLFNNFLSKRIETGLPLNSAVVGDCVVYVERSGKPLLTTKKIVSAKALDEVNDAIEAGKLRLALPLVGFKKQLSLGVQGEIEKDILEEENVGLHNFKIRDMHEISARGYMRTALTPINHFVTGEILVDPGNRRQTEVHVSFMLYTGSYATVLLRELMKPRNLIKTGF